MERKPFSPELVCTAAHLFEISNSLIISPLKDIEIVLLQERVDCSVYGMVTHLDGNTWIYEIFTCEVSKAPFTNLIRRGIRTIAEVNSMHFGKVLLEFSLKPQDIS